jgi:elongator complex protein 1
VRVRIFSFFPPNGKAESVETRCHDSVPLDETAALVPHLLRFTPLHRTAARELQNEVAAFSREMAEAFDEVWSSSTEDAETVVEPAAELADSWAARMAEREKERERAIKAIIKPELRATTSWCTRLLDAVATS